jgi:catalase
MYDAVYLPGGKASVDALLGNGDVLHFIEETFKHYKTIAATTEGAQLVRRALGGLATQPGIVTGGSAAAIAASFVSGIAQDRHWDRQGTGQVSA